MARNKHRTPRRPKARKRVEGKRPRVVAFFGEEQPGTCAMIRVIMPFKYARRKGYNFDHVRHQDAYRAALAGYPMEKYDIYVFPRLGDMDGEALKLITDLQGAGKTVVWETDDDYTNKHRRVIAADALVVARACNAVTVSTPWLATQYRPHNDQVCVLENCIDPLMWRPFESNSFRRVKGLTIGVGGTPTHYEDWQVILVPIQEILREFPFTTFVIMGYAPDYFELLPRDRVEFIPPLSYVQYPLAVRQVDIGLAPLDATEPFNLSKSAIKVLEYWASTRQYPNGQMGGAAAIASDMPVYQRVISHEHNGLLVENTEDAWHTAIRRLVKEKALRQRLGVAGHRYALKRRNIQSRAGEWITTYRKISSACS